MSANRIVLKRNTSAPFAHSPCHHKSFRPLLESDVNALGELIYDAYRGTIDDDGQSPKQAKDEALSTFQGKYGSVNFEASFGIFQATRLVSATVVTDYEKLRPLLAFVLTHPDCQKQGLATYLIEKTLGALQLQNQQTIHLVVTDGNPALTLYKKLGFESFQES